jgi:hypothetical protein
MARKRFIKVKNNYFAVSQILSLRRTAPSMGRDNVERCLVLRVKAEAVGAAVDAKFGSVWLSEEEAEDLLRLLQEETRWQEKNS